MNDIMLDVTFDSSLLTSLGANLYREPQGVIAVRELVQNAVDACIRKHADVDVKVNIANAVIDGHTRAEIEVIDKGVGMTPDQIRNDFIHVGGHRGDYDRTDQTGRFGVAKCVIFTAFEWYVKTLKWTAVPENGRIKVSKSESPIDGTVVKVVTKSLSRGWEKSMHKAVAMVDFCRHTLKLQIDGNVYDVGESVDKEWKQVKHVENDVSGVKFNIKATPAYTVGRLDMDELVVIRINGLPQIVWTSGVEGLNYVIDLEPDADADYPLVNSRDDLKSKWSEAINDWLSTVKVDSVTAEQDYYEPEHIDHKYIGGKSLTEGWRLSGSRATMQDVLDMLEQLGGVLPSSTPKKDEGTPRYILVNYDGELSSKDFNLLKLWSMVCERVAWFNFVPGLLGQSMARAKFRYYDNEIALLLNPSVVRRELPFSPTAKILYLWALANHETVHRDLSIHDEKFTSSEITGASASADFLADLLVDKTALSLARLCHE